MGHANTTNISQCFNRLIHRGGVSVRECIEELKRRGEAVHASEGDLDEPYMLGMVVEQIVSCLFEECLIEPIDLTRKQKAIFNAWKREENGDWDSGDDGDGGEYGIFDSIKWRATIRYLEN